MKNNARMTTNNLPANLSAAVLQFCQENIDYTGHLSIHGNVTVIADLVTTVAFFSKNLCSDEGDYKISIHHQPRHMYLGWHL